MESEVRSRVVQTSLEMTIIRADGTREDLGVVGFWHKNPLKRFAWWVSSRFKRLRAFIKGMMGL